MAAFAIPLTLAGLGLAAATMGGDERSTGTGNRTTQAADTTLLTAGGESGAAVQRTRTDNRQRTPNAEETGRTAQPRPLRTDNRRPTANAQQTGRSAVPRGTGTGPGADDGTDRAAGVGAAVSAGKRTKRKLGAAAQRPGTLLTGPVIPADLNPRTLLGY